MSGKKKSLFAATCVVTGNSIGSGVMAIPFFIQKAGILGAMIAFAAAYIVSIILHMMIAEVLLTGKSENDILEAFRTYLFKGKLKPVLTTGFFIVLVIALVSNLAAYISGTAEILEGLVPLPGAVVKVLFYVVCAAIVLMGLRTVGLSEKITVGFMCVLLVPTIIVSVMHKNGTGMGLTGGIDAFAAGYSMIMFSLSAIFAIPQIIEILDNDTKEIRQSIYLGIGLNLLMSIAVAACAIMTSKEVTKLAIMGWADAVGGAVRVFGSLFVVCAMMTSFWSIGFAACEMVRIRTKLPFFPCFCIATLPSLALTFFLNSEFTNYMKIAGGAIAMIISLMVIPTFVLCMRGKKTQILTAAGASVFSVAFVFAMHILMAVGSVIDF